LVLELLECRTLLTVTIAGESHWANEGPAGPIQQPKMFSEIGAIESIAVQPIGGHYIVFAGTADGGVWRAGTEFTTSDGVQHWFGDITPSMLTGGDPTQIFWVPMSDYQPSLAISSLALDPTNPNPPDPSHITLWAGTGSLSSNFQPGQPIGLLKTTDGGSDWTALGTDLAGQRIVSVVPTTVYQPGQVVLVACLDGSGIMRSTNGGQTFQSVPATDSNGNAITLSGQATDVIADPLDGDRFFAAVVGFGGTSKSGVFESDDDGATWTEMPGDSGTMQITGADNLKLAAQPNGNGVGTTLFVATGANGQMSGGLVGTVIAGGVSQWNPVGGVPNQGGYVYPEDSGQGHFNAAADPTHSGVFYVCSYQTSVWVANTNNSTSPWLNLDGFNGETKIHDDQRALTFLGPNSLLVTNDGGMSGLANPTAVGTSSFAGQQWVALNAGLRTNEQFSATYDPSTGLIFAGSQDNDVDIQTSPGASTWQTMPLSRGDGFNTAVDAPNKAGNRNHYYVTDGIVTRDGTGVTLAGLSTTPVVPGATTDQKQFARAPFTGQAIAASPTTFNRMMVGYTGIYESTDGGKSVNNLTPSAWNSDVNTGAGQYNVVKDIAYSADGLEAAYLSTYIAGGTGGGRLWVRSSGSSPFTEIPLASLPWNAPGRVLNANQLNVGSIAVDPYDYHYAYFLLTDKEVWETTNAGAAGSWINLTDNLSESGFNLGPLAGPSSTQLAVVDPNPTAGGQGALVVGGLGGVYAHQVGSANTGWQSVGNGLPNVFVTGLQYVGSKDILVASTFGRGAFLLGFALASVSGTAPRDITVTGDDSLQNHIVIDSSPSIPNCVEITLNGRLEYSGPAAGVHSITVDESQNAVDLAYSYANDTVDVNSAWVNFGVTVNEGNGTDTVNIAAETKVFRAGDYFVQINPGQGYDSINVYDSNDTVGDTLNVTATSVSEAGSLFPDTVNFSNQQKVTIFGGARTRTPAARGQRSISRAPGAIRSSTSMMREATSSTLGAKATRSASGVKATRCRYYSRSISSTRAAKPRPAMS
jgi:hypothetical protein